MYKSKYLKYKAKYLKLMKQRGGASKGDSTDTGTRNELVKLEKYTEQICFPWSDLSPEEFMEKIKESPYLFNPIKKFVKVAPKVCDMPIFQALNTLCGNTLIKYPKFRKCPLDIGIFNGNKPISIFERGLQYLNNELAELGVQKNLDDATNKLKNIDKDIDKLSLNINKETNPQRREGMQKALQATINKKDTFESTILGLKDQVKNTTQGRNLQKFREGLIELNEQTKSMAELEGEGFVDLVNQISQLVTPSDTGSIGTKFEEEGIYSFLHSPYFAEWITNLGYDASILPDIVIRTDIAYFGPNTKGIMATAGQLDAVAMYENKAIFCIELKSNFCDLGTADKQLEKLVRNMANPDIEFRDGRDNILSKELFQPLCDGKVNRLNIITGIPKDLVAMPGTGSQRMKALACLYKLNGAPKEELIRVVNEIKSKLLEDKRVSPMFILRKYQDGKSSCLLGVL